MSLLIRIKNYIRPCKRAFRAAHNELQDNCCEIDEMIKKITKRGKYGQI